MLVAVRLGLGRRALLNAGARADIVLTHARREWAREVEPELRARASAAAAAIKDTEARLRHAREQQEAAAAAPAATADHHDAAPASNEGLVAEIAERVARLEAALAVYREQVETIKQVLAAARDLDKPEFGLDLAYNGAPRGLIAHGPQRAASLLEERQIYDLAVLPVGSEANESALRSLVVELPPDPLPASASGRKRGAKARRR